MMGARTCHVSLVLGTGGTRYWYWYRCCCHTVRLERQGCYCQGFFFYYSLPTSLEVSMSTGNLISFFFWLSRCLFSCLPRATPSRQCLHQSLPQQDGGCLINLRDSKRNKTKKDREMGLPVSISSQPKKSIICTLHL